MSEATSAVLERLFRVIESRRGGDADASYTAGLLARGKTEIAAKVLEEAAETARAALRETPERLTSESADLLYHLLVLWADGGIEPADVWAELARREGTSGLAEKRARTGDES